MFKKNNKRATEIEFYKKTQENAKNVGREKRITSKFKKEKADFEWYKPAALGFSFGLWIAFMIIVQSLAMTIHNLNKKQKPVGFFFNSGVWLYLLIIGLIVCPIAYKILHRRFYTTWFQNNIEFMDGDIEEFKNDAYVRTMDHLTREFDVCPDVGLGFDGHVSTLLSHAMISNKGIKKIKVPVYDPNVDGFVKRDKEGNIVYETKPMFDEELAETLFSMSGVPQEHRIFYNATDYDFNPLVPKKEGGDGKKRQGVYDRLAYDKLSDVINNEFFVLDTETQRPAGVYFYDRLPKNTILIAITRGGKGQTYIEPSIDVWRREKNQWNFAATDPKGELIAKFYYPCTKRGMEVVQFNLMKPALTNVFNPLINAIMQFRQNDDVKGTTLIDSIVSTLFPDNGEIWNPAAGNMFRRAVYMLFDYVIEQEKYIRYLAYKNGVAPEIVDEEIDKLYSQVTLYNVYNMIGDLGSKISKDTSFINVNPEVPVEAEKDLLTLAFDAMCMLPKNKLRSLAMSANNSIKSIASAPQTLAGIYASLLTGLSIYGDPTTIALMSGSISDSFDVTGLSFPRRVGIQLNREYTSKYRLVNEVATWTCYRDPEFKDKYEGEDFEHIEKIEVSNWVWAYFKGIFDQDVVYLKLKIESSGTLVKTFYFRFTKGYRKFNSVSYIIDEITNDKIVLGGTLVELDPVTKEPNISEFSHESIDYVSKSKRNVTSPIIVSNQVFYSERPKAIFFIVPPHLQHYQKHVLIMIKQMTDEIYSMSYSTKSNRKPILGMRYMLDEFGNIRSGDMGIPNIDTITSIALGQDVQLTFVLQSFQQLRSVYGEDVEKIIRSNSSNTVFLKSNDEELINELVRLSGVKHEIRTKGRSYQKNYGDVVTVAEPIISYSSDHVETTALASNDLLFLAGKNPGNGIVFMSNEMPIVNKLSTITPMAAGLHKRLPQPKTGVYSDSNLPTSNLSDTLNFMENTIDGEGLVKARVAQAKIAYNMRKEILDIAKKYEFDISETNGELAELMMNLVYEAYENNSDIIRTSLSNTRSYHDIAVELEEHLNNILDDSNDDNVVEFETRKLQDLLIMLLTDKNLDYITALYRDKTSNESTLGYDINSVFKFIVTMRKEFPNENKIRNLEKKDLYKEAAKDKSYTGYYDADFPYDIRNTYVFNPLQDIIWEARDEGRIVDGVNVQADKVFIKGKHVANLIGGESMGHIEYILKAREIADIISSVPSLKERLDRSAKNE